MALLKSLHSRHSLSLTTEDMRSTETSQVKALVDVGLLSEHQDAEYAICEECADRCYVKVHRVFDPEGRPLKAYCQCEERDDIIGRIEIPFERLVEWRTNTLNLAKFLSMLLGITAPPVGLVSDRIWRLGPIRYAGQRADVFLSIAPADDDFLSLWPQVALAVDQCSSPVMLVPGETPVAQFAGHKVKVLSLTRLLCVDNGQLTLDVDEIRHAAGIIGSPAESSDDRFIHNEDYTAVSLDGMPYVLTTNQAMVIKALHEAYQRRTYWLGKDYLLEDLLETNSNRLRDTFKSNLEAWKNLIASDKRGRYRLNLPTD